MLFYFLITLDNTTNADGGLEVTPADRAVEPEKNVLVNSSPIERPVVRDETHCLPLLLGAEVSWR